ncbi:hypothetical protein llap_6946 [Limosa lapponica baueri]|uniref:Uncharacterized protein n=1 Tax=Limosa lapponica baueri TaxID=1758121 RepID=A0A2I0U9M2_LIMLA|nr:hypothetical protein llap_6946 [Limosa lapponica baueri]
MKELRVLGHSLAALSPTLSLEGWMNCCLLSSANGLWDKTPERKCVEGGGQTWCKTRTEVITTQKVQETKRTHMSMREKAGLKPGSAERRLDFEYESALCQRDSVVIRVLKESRRFMASSQCLYGSMRNSIMEGSSEVGHHQPHSTDVELASCTPVHGGRLGWRRTPIPMCPMMDKREEEPCFATPIESHMTFEVRGT